VAQQKSYKERLPDYRRVADGLRHEILSGKFLPGVQLPSKRDLAVIWNSSSFTIHSAVQELIKEGWLITRGSAGTYLADAKFRFVCAGIYHSSDIFSNEQMAFSRTVHTSLLRQLQQLEKTVQVFVDTRPYHDHSELFPPLAEALLYRKVQCLIAPTINDKGASALAGINVPTAFMSNPSSRNQIIADKKILFCDSLRELAAQGCRTVGLISHVRDRPAANEPDPDFYGLFRRNAAEQDLVYTDDWIRGPTRNQTNFERYGYERFHKLWKLREKPEGIIVYPDIVARGTISAILELGVNNVCPRMKFIFHRNAGTDVICPFHVTWAISDPAQVASELINLIQRQFNGEKTSPFHLCHTFQAS
jgi:DNA-binding LacI/PurR family transcriptional regulator